MSGTYGTKDRAQSKGRGTRIATGSGLALLVIIVLPAFVHANHISSLIFERTILPLLVLAFLIGFRTPGHLRCPRMQLAWVLFLITLGLIIWQLGR